VKFTRDRSSDLGGGAIPTRVILEQFPELRSLQQEFHECDRRWSSLISKSSEIDFQPYLRAIVNHYDQQRDLYTPTDALLPLEARSVERQEGEDRQEKKVEQFPVLAGLRKYALGEKREHVLLAGRPGSGKSTALRQLALDLAEEAIQNPDLPIPVLVQLKADRSVPKLIQAEFRRTKRRVTSEQIDDWLLNDRLILLLDGVNEVPTDNRRQALALFREDNLSVPIVFTTRDLAVGGDLGIGKRLEMKPLSPEQMKVFVGKYLPEHGEQLLRQLRDRLRELAETPLLLKMLCDVFDPETGQIPQSKGELFRLFDRKYEDFKGLPAVSADFRRFKSEVLQHLAFVMMQGDDAKPTEFELTIERSTAERTIEQWLVNRVSDPAGKAKEWLEDLLEHHLLQVAADQRQVEFHHQLFQEYYAAEYLRQQLPDLLKDENRFKRDYLNYLKWTEPVALMLAVVDEEAQAVQVVKLALDADLMLGARLSGEVKPVFQTITVGLVDDLEMSSVLKYQWWVTTRSTKAIPGLLKALEDQDSSVRWSAAKALGNLGSVEAIPGLLKALENKVPCVRWNAVYALGMIGNVEAIPGLLKALEDQDSGVRESAVNALGMIGNVEAIPEVLQALEGKDSDVHRSGADAPSLKIIPGAIKLIDSQNPGFHRMMVGALKETGNVEAIPEMLKALEDQDSFVRKCAAYGLGMIGSVEVIPRLFKALEDQDSDVRESAVNALGMIGSVEAIPGLLKALEDQDFFVRWRAASLLRRVGSHLQLAVLWQLHCQQPDQYLWDAISAIQNHYQFYNYEIFQAHLAVQKADRPTNLTSDCPSTANQVNYDLRGAAIANFAHEVHGNQIVQPEKPQ